MRAFWRWRVCLAAFGLCACVNRLDGQLITSWEGDPEVTVGTPDGLELPNGWVVPDFTTSPAVLTIESDPDGIGDKGITDGAQSLGITMTGANNGSGDTHFDRPAFFNVGPGSGDVYSLFDAVGNDPAGYTLDFDVTFDPAVVGGFTQGQSPFVALGAFANSDGGFTDVFNIPVLNPTELAGPSTFPISVQANQLNYTAASSFYQFGFTLNGNWDVDEDTTIYIDNLRFTELPDLIEETLYSWETPDDSSTPDVNEQFEGWTEGFEDGHSHSISATGATDGSHALQIDRTGLPNGFAWGSQVELTGDDQAEIDEIVGLIEQSQFIAVDLTFDDAFPASPSFGQLWMHISDNAGNFFQSTMGDFDIANAAEETTVTLQQPLSAFNDGALNLVADGLAEGTDFLRFGLAFNTDAATVYQIDNFRLIRQAIEAIPGDTNGDGEINFADLSPFALALTDVPAYMESFPGLYPTSCDVDEDGNCNFGDLSPFVELLTGGEGSAEGTAVPEPSLATSLLLLAASMIFPRYGKSVRK